MESIRNGAFRELTDQYLVAFREHCGGGGETVLRRAYELGRQAMSRGLGVLEMAGMHHAALAATAFDADSPAQRAERALAFFAESLAPFEMTHRGFQETIITLRESNQRLATLNRELEREIAKRKLAERDIRFQAGILSQVHDAVLAVDREGRVTYCNHGAEELLRRKAAELMGQKAEDIIQVRWIATEDEQEAADALRRTGSWRGETMGVMRDGDERRLESSVSVLRDEAGAESGLLAVVRDVTERKKLERMVFHSEKLAAMGRMTAGLAHEFTTPLSVILGFAETAREKLPKGHKVAASLEIIRNQSIRLTGLVQTLLGFSRKKKTGAGRPFDVNASIRQVLPLLRAQARVKMVDVVLELAEEPISIKGQSDQLEQLIINLSDNAFDAMPRGGALTIRTRKVIIKDQPHVQVEVADSGAGVPSEVREKMFEPFFTTKAEGKGTGLGLWIVHEIVVRHGGDIQCASRKGRGTTFTATFQAA